MLVDPRLVSLSPSGPSAVESRSRREQPLFWMGLHQRGTYVHQQAVNN